MSAHKPSPFFARRERAERYAVRLLVPDLPSASEVLPYLQRIDAARWYSNFGPLVLEFEQRLGVLTGGHCVTLSSGTAALELGIAALDLPPGSRVLLPAFTFPSSLLAVMRCGLKPVLCDVSPDGWLLTPDIAREALAFGEFGLVLPVAAFGVPLPTEAWARFARETGARVLIDAAAALGAQRIGAGVDAAYSLHATKPLGIGEGGVFSTAEGDLAERVRRLSNYGLTQNRIDYAGGTNAKLSEYAAAVGLAQLERREALFASRAAIWVHWVAALGSLDGVRLQCLPAEEIPPAVLVVDLPSPSTGIAHALEQGGIETRRWYLPPLHHHPAFRDVEMAGAASASLRVTERLSVHLLGLPFHTRLSRADVERVTRALSEALEV